MSAPIDRLAFAFQQIERSRRAIAGSSSLKRRDLDFAYQGLFLFGVRKFESFLEEQLIGLASGSLKWPQRKLNGKLHKLRPILSGVSDATVRSLITGPNDYPKLLPFDACISLAERVLKGGVPFSLVAEPDKGRLTRCQAIRNLIAHDSAAAKKKFEKAVLAQHPLPVYRRNPAGYLSAKFSQQQTYFETELSELLRIARLLT